SQYISMSLKSHGFRSQNRDSPTESIRVTGVVERVLSDRSHESPPPPIRAGGRRASRMRFNSSNCTALSQPPHSYTISTLSVYNCFTTACERDCDVRFFSENIYSVC